ncbi:hypothetical protein DPMN_154737 [Dreissena polymorpha]|uniref:Uncharacterized protein n=1 Tax=Dreissena polymorpha TaxID=45954 RepID=A0A9D4FSD5_DREPO|nr:hypothetical protein DPMN_154737 [Dreissena polymorpha]
MDHGRLIHYCLLGTMKLTLNSRLSDLKTCYHYECVDNGLFSYPIGPTLLYHQANKEMLAECDLIYVACKPIWVMKSNEMIYCPHVPEGIIAGK